MRNIRKSIGWALMLLLGMVAEGRAEVVLTLNVESATLTQSAVDQTGWLDAYITMQKGPTDSAPVLKLFDFDLILSPSGGVQLIDSRKPGTVAGDPRPYILPSSPAHNYSSDIYDPPEISAADIDTPGVGSAIVRFEYLVPGGTPAGTWQLGVDPNYTDMVDTHNNGLSYSFHSGSIHVESTSTPEPTTIVGLATGGLCALGIACYRRRRVRAAGFTPPNR